MVFISNVVHCFTKDSIFLLVAVIVNLEHGFQSITMLDLGQTASLNFECARMLWIFASFDGYARALITNGGKIALSLCSDRDVIDAYTHVHNRPVYWK